jgi:hypothetical protein
MSGALEAAHSTNIQLLTFQELQEIYFEKWYEKRPWAMEGKIRGFHTYYEMIFGKPGYSLLESDEERAAMTRCRINIRLLPDTAALALHEVIGQEIRDSGFTA